MGFFNNKDITWGLDSNGLFCPACGYRGGPDNSPLLSYGGRFMCPRCRKHYIGIPSSKKIRKAIGRAR